ncbi:MAG: hypothetical protein HRU20_27450 [Pseudomonadales bacterium]|nr:hypothetical protein [Pseudomonadales bacterium]
MAVKSLLTKGVIQQQAWFSILPILMDCSYLILATMVGFEIPFIGILLSTMCFTVAAVLIHL